MKKFFVLSVFFLAGCNGSDYRHANVVVTDDEFLPVVEEATVMWNKAFPSVDLHIATTCSESETCIYVTLGDPVAFCQEVGDDNCSPAVGHTHNNNNTAEIVILPSIASNSDNRYNLKTITHELGHALGLKHVDSTDEIMYSHMMSGNTLDCIGDQTISEFQDEYGDTGSVTCFKDVVH